MDSAPKRIYPWYRPDPADWHGRPRSPPVSPWLSELAEELIAESDPEPND
jgi:hypothetical protein